ncbi:MAG: hypothetical protein ACRDRX_04320 [Pseudonocardiaceae bacterium]
MSKTVIPPAGEGIPVVVRARGAGDNSPADRVVRAVALVAGSPVRCRLACGLWLASIVAWTQASVLFAWDQRWGAVVVSVLAVVALIGAIVTVVQRSRP